MNSLHQEINQFCAALGKDPLLVQGAGGNVSWKEDDLLWIKGSGTWLAHADQNDIFVPVNLMNLSRALMQKDFDFQPQLIGAQTLCPSIETSLHALMPQKIVAHLHAIFALTYLINKDSQKMIAGLFQQLTDGTLKVAFVQYQKPGSNLAQAILEVLAIHPNANVIFLKNHGIVVGADSIDQLKILLKKLESILSRGKTINAISVNKLPSVEARMINEYIPFPDLEVQALALDPNLFGRLSSDWVLYPDHAVFLGAKAFTYTSWDHFLLATQERPGALPELVFIQNIGVFIKLDFTLAKFAQLRCYFDVISRVAPDDDLDPLSNIEIQDLLNWDAEKLRQRMSG